MARIFVLVDALGWTYLKDRDFLPGILTFRTEVQTVLGFSSGAIPTLLSGMLPKKSGHWNLFYYDPENSPFRWMRPLCWLPAPMLNSRVIRRVVRLVSQRVSRFGGYFQIYGVPVELLPFFDICEKVDIYRPGGVPGSIFDSLQESGIPFRSYSYHQMSDRDIIAQACHDFKKHCDDFYFIYLSQMDEFLHHWCADEQRVEEKIREYERWLYQLYTEAQQAFEDVDFVVCSDHGMTPKHAGYDLLAEINSLGLKVPEEYLALYDSTMARFWCFTDRARTQIQEKLEALHTGRVLDRRDQERYGIDFSDNRFGDVIFLMNPGVVIEPSFMGKRGPEGMHGFDPEQDPCSAAAFLSNRNPGRPVKTLIDVHAVMLDWVDSMRGAIRVQS